MCAIRYIGKNFQFPVEIEFHLINKLISTNTQINSGTKYGGGCTNMETHQGDGGNSQNRYKTRIFWTKQSHETSIVHDRKMVLSGRRNGDHHQGQTSQQEGSTDSGRCSSFDLPRQLHSIRDEDVLGHRQKGEHGQLRGQYVLRVY